MLKAGDRVRFIDAPEFIYDEVIGREGTVTKVDDSEVVHVLLNDEIFAVYKYHLQKTNKEL